MNNTLSVEERFWNTIEAKQLITSNTAVLAMVSGGSDSTALAYLAAGLYAQGKIKELAFLHVNHGLRGKDSDADQAFVQALAAFLDIPLFICELNLRKELEQSGGNLEALARHERYKAADEALQSMCFHTQSPLEDARIMVAHTQDDRVESFYMRSIVGTGPGGFRSLRYSVGQVIRPCLDLSREDLRQYIGKFDAHLESDQSQGKRLPRTAQGELWCDDATNADTDYFRSYVRHEIVPRAQARNPRLLEVLCRTMEGIADEDDYLENLAHQAEGKCVLWEEAEDERCCTLNLDFIELPLVLKRRVLVHVLKKFMGEDARIEQSSIQGIISLCDIQERSFVPAQVLNIQGNLVASTKKRELLLEPMDRFRARRKLN